ncbi:MAG: hypothetical protein Q4C37_11115 [Bacteroidales bacterium]|nr:hypothetical protein [Bacteroidales bacterium]
MKNETKHMVAYIIYNSAVKTKRIFIRELKFIWKPLLIGLAIFVVCATIAEWSDFLFGRNNKEPWIIFGFIGLFAPTLYLYYIRLKKCVLKWKDM